MHRQVFENIMGPIGSRNMKNIKDFFCAVFRRVKMETKLCLMDGLVQPFQAVQL